MCVCVCGGGGGGGNNNRITKSSTLCDKVSKLNEDKIQSALQYTVKVMLNIHNTHEQC